MFLFVYPLSQVSLCCCTFVHGLRYDSGLTSHDDETDTGEGTVVRVCTDEEVIVWVETVGNELSPLLGLF